MILGPRLPPEALKTYTVRQNPAVKVPKRLVTCEEYGCLNWKRGWVCTLDETTDQGAFLAKLARTAGRRFVESRDGALTVLTFERGQECFDSAAHLVDTDERPALFLVRGGTGAVNPRRTPTATRTAQGWVDDFGEHQETLADRFNQG